MRVAKSKLVLVAMIKKNNKKKINLVLKYV